MTKNPWTTLSSRAVYENPWISVREDSVIQPDGNKGIYGVVSTRTATGVVARAPSGNVLLVVQYRYPIERYSWEIPEGGGEPTEDPLTIVKRELQEETGYEAATWTKLAGPVYLSNCFSSEALHLFMADDLTFVGSQPDPTEELEVREESFSHCLEMIKRGEIHDAASIVALFLAKDVWGQ